MFSSSVSGWRDGLFQQVIAVGGQLVKKTES